MTAAPSAASQGPSLTGTDPASVRRRIETMEKLLEGLFVIPGTNFRVGLDAILSIVPVGGSVVAAVMGSWMAWEANNVGMPKRHLIRMMGNIGLDALLGAIPVIGAVPDLFFRSNTRNMKLFLKWMDKNHPGTAIIDQ